MALGVGAVGTLVCGWFTFDPLLAIITNDATSQWDLFVNYDMPFLRWLCAVLVFGSLANWAREKMKDSR